MNYEETREYLNLIKKYGSVLGLDTIKRLLGLLGNPQDELKVIHVAGTNGKGSTSNLIRACLMKAGLKVGYFSSPAVFHERETITINGSMIDEESLARIVSVIKEKCDYMVANGLAHPTPFEIETTTAIMYFVENNCDVVIMECGMGGKTDATNVFKKTKVDVITSISLDHTGFLGKTLKDISQIKAGIITEKGNAIVANNPAEVTEVIEEVVKRKGASLVKAGKAKFIDFVDGCQHIAYKASNGKEYNISLAMLGTYQLTNVATAMEVILSYDGGKYEAFIEEGMSNVVWNGRMEKISDSPLFYIDGAHNPGAVKQLLSTIDLYFTNDKITFIMGVLADKDFEKECEIIAQRAEMIFAITPNNERGLDGEILKNTIMKYNKSVYATNIADAISKAKQLGNTIIAFGSLSYLKDIKEAVR